MQIALSSLAFKEFDINKTIGLIKDLGFDFIDLTIIPKFCDHYDIDFPSVKETKSLLSKLEKSNIGVASINLVPGWLVGKKSDIAVQRICNAIDLADQLNTKVVTIPIGPAVSLADRQEIVNDNIKSLRNLLDYADKRSVELSLEIPHYGTLVQTANEASDFLHELNDNRAKVTFDTSHVFKGEKISLENAIEHIGLENINHIHLRDVRGDDILITPGKGNIDFGAFFNTLQNKGYTGHLTLEIEKPSNLKKNKREIKFAKEFLEKTLKGEALTQKLRLQRKPLALTIGRLIDDPKKELKQYEIIMKPWRMVKPFIKPMVVFEGQWIKKRNKPADLYFPKLNSVPLTKKPSSSIKVCIIGCGGAGSRWHGPGYWRLQDVNVVGVADINTDSAKMAGEKLNCRYYTDYGEMLKAENPEIVSVCTREWQHLDPVLKSFENGANVFCEKIMASRIEDAQTMVETAEKNNKLLAVNYNYRFMVGFQAIHDLINLDLLGKLQMLHIKVHAFSYHHALDLICFLGGKIRSVRASYENDDELRPFGGTPWSKFDPDILYVPSKNMAATFSLDSGAVAVITSSIFPNTSGFIIALDATFDRGEICLNGINMNNTIGKLTCSDPVILKKIKWEKRLKNTFTRNYEYCFFRSIESFMNSYVQGIEPETPAKQGIYIMKLEKAIDRSNTSRCEVTIGVPKAEGVFGAFD